MDRLQQLRDTTQLPPHLVRFQAVQIDGALPPPNLAGWKDTVYVAPGSTVTLDVPIPDLQPDGHPYMFHCHILMHEDQGMMGQFELLSEDPNRAAAPKAQWFHDR